MGEDLVAKTRTIQESTGAFVGRNQGRVAEGPGSVVRPCSPLVQRLDSFEQNLAAEKKEPEEQKQRETAEAAGDSTCTDVTIPDSIWWKQGRVPEGPGSVVRPCSPRVRRLDPLARNLDVEPKEPEEQKQRETAEAAGDSIADVSIPAQLGKLEQLAGSHKADLKDDLDAKTQTIQDSSVLCFSG